MRTAKNKASIVLLSALILSVLFPGEVMAAGKKTSIWVIKKTVATYGDGTKSTEKYSYTKDGLITKIKEDDNGFVIYQYDKKGRFKKRLASLAGEKAEVDARYKYDKAGRVKAVMQDSYTYEEMKYNDDGKCVDYRAHWASLKMKLKYNRKGLLKSYEYNKGGSFPHTNETYFYYDKSNNIKRLQSSGVDEEYENYGNEEKYKNTYKKGRLIKRKERTHINVKYTYSYKKVRVPKNRVEQVRAQQSWIRAKLLAGWYPPLEAWY